MFNIGFGEMILLGVIALIFIGPKQLPEVARTIGKLLNELKRATEEVTGTFLSAKDRADQATKKITEQLTEQAPNQSEPKTMDKTAIKTPVETPIESVDTKTASSGESKKV